MNIQTSSVLLTRKNLASQVKLILENKNFVRLSKIRLKPVLSIVSCLTDNRSFQTPHFGYVPVHSFEITVFEIKIFEDLKAASGVPTLIKID